LANAANWRSWFLGMGLAGFLPVILLLGWRLINKACAERQTCGWCRETVGTANVDDIGLCSPCHDAALDEKETTGAGSVDSQGAVRVGDRQGHQSFGADGGCSQVENGES